MGEISGFMVEKIENTGTANNEADGSHYIKLSVKLKGGLATTLFFPISMFASLMTALSSAGLASRNERLTRLGSDQNMADVDGFTAWFPTDFDLGRAKRSDGENCLLIRLKTDKVPVVEAMFGYQGAEALATAILQEVAKGEPPQKGSH